MRRRCAQDGQESAVPLKERLHILDAETAVAPLADAVEGQLAPIAEALHGVHMKMEHLGDFARREHRAKLVYGHGSHRNPLLGRLGAVRCLSAVPRNAAEATRTVSDSTQPPQAVLTVTGPWYDAGMPPPVPVPFALDAATQP